MKARVEKENWSKESKQSLSYEFAEKYYKDKVYKCYKCNKSDTFTGQEQKLTYEVKKDYIWQQRRLCNKCYCNLKELKIKVSHFEQLWSKESEDTKKSANYINEWLVCIEEVPLYGKPRNESLAVMLQKYINKNA